MKTYKNEVKNKQNINEHISAQNFIIKLPLLPVFISSVNKSDKILHEICIFVNINEILKVTEKTTGKL